MQSFLFFFCIISTVSWKDDYAVKKLIHLWKINQLLFKNCKIRNDVVWRQIAKELQASNPNWVYTGIQCENKFKDIRKKYVKMKVYDANSTGGDRRTCKFCEEMEEVFGDKPCIKPVAITSTLCKRPMNDSVLSSSTSFLYTLTSEEDRIQEASPLRKRGQIEKSLQEWTTLMRQDSLQKENERERHKEKFEKQEKVIATYEKAIAIYEKLMIMLLDKL